MLVLVTSERRAAEMAGGPRCAEVGRERGPFVLKEIEENEFFLFPPLSLSPGPDTHLLEETERGAELAM